MYKNNPTYTHTHGVRLGGVCHVVLRGSFGLKLQRPAGNGRNNADEYECRLSMRQREVTSKPQQVHTAIKIIKNCIVSYNPHKNQADLSLLDGIKVASNILIGYHSQT